MDKHLDGLAKDLAKGVTRREAMRRLGGGLIGAVLVSLGLGKPAHGQLKNTSPCAFPTHPALCEDGTFICCPRDQACLGTSATGAFCSGS